MLNKIKELSNSFLSKIKELLENHSILVSDFYLDHMCYRVETISQYTELISNLDHSGLLLSDSIIGGRPISTFKIKGLASYYGQEISVIEIPSPKEKSPYREGFEHVEFVIDCNLEDFVRKYPKVVFDTKNAHKIINPDVRLRSEDNSISIKFHMKSLEDLIAQEKT